MSRQQPTVVDATSIDALGFRPIEGSPFGATSAADLRRALSDTAAAELRKAFDRHKLLHFSRQHLTAAQQRGVLRHLGPVMDAADDAGEISVDGTLGTTRLAFHSDLSFTAEPIAALSLHALEIEDGVTTTSFADSERAWDLLPSELRRAVAPLSAVSLFAIVQSRRAIPSPLPDFVPRYERAAVIPHPRTDRQILYVSEMQTACLSGLPHAQSEALLHRLFAYLYEPANIYEHRWRAGDLLIWDNLALQHARPSLEGVTKRRLQRARVAQHSFAELCPDFDPRDPRLRQLGPGLELATA